MSFRLKELLERRFKNKKIEIEESLMSHIIKKLGYKETSDFYKDIADEKLDANTVIERYIEVRDHDSGTRQAESAENFEYKNPNEKQGYGESSKIETAHPKQKVCLTPLYSKSKEIDPPPCPF